MRFDMLLHVVALDEAPGAIGAFVGLVSTVDFPVAVQGAGISQFFAADLASDGRFAVGRGHWRRTARPAAGATG